MFNPAIFSDTLNFFDIRKGCHSILCEFTVEISYFGKICDTCMLQGLSLIPLPPPSFVPPPSEWQWQLGAIAVFLGWIDLIIFIRKLPLTGIYVVMFIDIFYTFCRLFFLSFLLVVAFGLAFYMTFNDPDLMVCMCMCRCGGRGEGQGGKYLSP